MLCNKCKLEINEPEMAENQTICSECKESQAEPVLPDYYYENGYMVFTEHYHLKRGYCCKHGCRHCPWKYTK